MKKIITIFFLMVTSLVLSQNSINFKVGDTIYYDKKYKITTANNAKILVIVKEKFLNHTTNYTVDLYKLDTVTDFYHKKAYFQTKALESLSKTGNYIDYWKNGNKMSEGVMYNNKKDGLWREWYKDGSIKSESTYFAPKKVFNKVKPFQLINFWNLSGEQTVTNGTGYYSYESSSGSEQKGKIVDYKKEGEWIGFRKDGSVYYKEIYKKGKLKKGESWDKKGKKYTYKEVFKQTTYSRGMKGIAHTIIKNFRVPAFAKNNNIRGSMLVNFTVNKKGNVVDAKVVRKLCKPCDKEALRIVNLLKQWVPAKSRGQNVNVKYALPLRIE